MKRSDPATGQPFKRGDLRKDGFVFLTYLPNKIKLDGFCQEKWLSPAAAERQFRAMGEAALVWSRKRWAERQQFIAEYKLEKGCMDCGYRLHPHALDFDHREGVDKCFEVSHYSGRVQNLLPEIEKCDVVCANCHRIRTHNRRSKQRKRLKPGRPNSVAA